MWTQAIFYSLWTPNTNQNLVTRPRGEKNYREDHDTEVKRPGRDTLMMMMMILTVDADDFDHSKRKERQGLHLHLHQHGRDEKHH